MGRLDGAGSLERFGTSLDGIRAWVQKAWRIGILMSKGAYLLGERRRLFTKLGEETYERMLKGEIQSDALEPMVRQLERLTKKVEIEEMLIRNARFGTRGSRPRAQSEEPTEPPSPAPDTTEGGPDA